MKNLLFLSCMSIALIPSVTMADTTAKCTIYEDPSVITSDYILQQPALNINQALQDRVAGIDFDGLSIRGIRSLTSLTDAPTYFLNGMPYHGSLSDIDPAEIVGIRILKDAATAAMYGSRGTDGIIFLYTRGNEAPQHTKVSYQGYVAAKQAFYHYPMMKAKDLRIWRKLHNEPILILSDGDENAYYPYPTSYNYFEHSNLDIDRQDIYQTAIEHKHLLSYVTSWKSGYINSGIGHSSNEGLLPNTDSHNTNVHFDLTQHLGQYVTLYVSGRYAHQKNKTNAGNFQEYLFLSPMLSQETPVDHAIKQEYYKLNDDRYYTDWNIHILCPWMEELSFDLRANRAGSFRKQESPNQTKYNNLLYKNRDRSTIVNAELNYNKYWASGHHLTLFGFYRTERHIDHYRATRDYEQVSGGRYSLQQSVSREDDSFHRHAQLYSARYDFAARYQVHWTSQLERNTVRSKSSSLVYNFSAGADSDYPSSKQQQSNSFFGYDLDWTDSHSLQLQWNIHCEGFASNWDCLHMLSLRFDQGIINKPYTLPDIEDGNEKFRSKNIGIDFGLWKGRLSGSFDLYKQQNSHLLNREVRRYYNSYQYQTVGFASTENRGFELSLQGIVIDHWHDLTWQLGLGLYANRNKLSAIDHNQDIYKDFLGMPVHTTKSMSFNYFPGDTIYEIVCEEPRLKGHFSSLLSWRNWDLNVIGSFQVGGNLYTDIDTYSPANRDYPINHTYTRYQTQEQSDQESRIIYSTENCLPRHHYNATICRIRVITLGYNLPTQWLEKLHLKQMRLYATVRNPFVFCSDLYKEFGIDPVPNTTYRPTSYPNTLDVDSRHSVNMVTFQVPTTRDYLIGLNITF